MIFKEFKRSNNREMFEFLPGAYEMKLLIFLRKNSNIHLI